MENITVNISIDLDEADMILQGLQQLHVATIKRGNDLMENTNSRSAAATCLSYADTLNKFISKFYLMLPEGWDDDDWDEETGEDL